MDHPVILVIYLGSVLVEASTNVDHDPVADNERVRFGGVSGGAP